MELVPIAGMAPWVPLGMLLSVAPSSLHAAWFQYNHKRGGKKKGLKLLLSLSAVLAAVVASLEKQWDAI